MSDDLQLHDCPIFIVVLVIALLSFVSNFIILLISLRHSKDKINKSNIVIINLLFSSFIHSIGYSLNFRKYDKLLFNYSLCYAQSLTMIISSMSIDSWVCIITFINFITLVNEKEVFKFSLFKLILFLIISYIIPSIIGFIFAYYELIGEAGINCWVKTKKIKFGFVLYGIKLFAFFIMTIISVIILIKVNIGQIKKKSDKFLILSKILMFPFIQLINISFPFIYFLFSFIQKSNSLQLERAMLICGCSIGLIYPIVYFTLDLISSKLEYIDKQNETYDHITKYTEGSIDNEKSNGRTSLFLEN